MSDLPGLLRRVGTYAGLLGATLIFVGDLIGKGNFGVISYVGIVLGVLSFLLGLVFSLRKRSFGWIGLLVVVAAISVATGLGGIGAVGSIDLINHVHADLLHRLRGVLSRSRRDITERSVIATLGLIAVLTIIISGTFAGGGGIGSNTDPKVYQLNLHMYAIAGLLALIAWLLAIANTSASGVGLVRDEPAALWHRRADVRSLRANRRGHPPGPTAEGGAARGGCALRLAISLHMASHRFQ